MASVITGRVGPVKLNRLVWFGKGKFFSVDPLPRATAWVIFGLVIWGDYNLDSPLIAAPMAGYSDLAYRIMARRYGAALAYTEMVSAAGVIRRDPKTWLYLKTHPAEGPLVVQLFGGRPDDMAAAAAQVEAAGYGALDLNMGCPVKKVLRQGSGSALMADLGKARAMARALRRAVSIPCFAKIRAGFRRADGPTAVETARMLEDEGFSGIVVHPRFASDGFSGRSDWDLIGRVVEAVAIPVVGSGDVVAPEDAGAMISRTGCAGVMIGRAAIGQPWLFEQCRDSLAGRPIRNISPVEVGQAVRAHLGWLVHYCGPEVAWLKLKGLIGRYLKGFYNAKPIRTAVVLSTSAEEAFGIMDDYLDRLTKGDQDEG